MNNIIKFRLSIGSFMNGHEVFEGEKDKSVTTIKFIPSFREEKRGKTKLKKILSLKEWEDFTQKMRKFTIDWQEEYFNPNIMDGLQWSLNLVFENGEDIKFKGSNSFPSNWLKFARFIGKTEKEMWEKGEES